MRAGFCALLLIVALGVTVRADPEQEALNPAAVPAAAESAEHGEGKACPTACCSPWSSGECTDSCEASEGTRLWYSPKVYKYVAKDCPVNKVCCKKKTAAKPCPSDCCSPWSAGECLSDCIDGTTLYYKDLTTKTFLSKRCPQHTVCCKKNTRLQPAEPVAEAEETDTENDAERQEYITDVYAKQTTGGVTYICEPVETAESLVHRFELPDGHIFADSIQDGAEIALGNNFQVTEVKNEESISQIKKSLGWPTAYDDDTIRIIKYNCLCGRKGGMCKESCPPGTFVLKRGWRLIVPARSMAHVKATPTDGVETKPVDPKNPIKRKEVRRVDTQLHKERCTDAQKKKCPSPCIKCMTPMEVHAMTAKATLCRGLKEGIPKRSDLGAVWGVFSSFRGSVTPQNQWHLEEDNQWLTGHKLGQYSIERMDDKSKKANPGPHEILPNKFLLHTIQGTWPYAGDLEVGKATLDKKKVWPHFIIARDNDCKLRIGQFLPLGKRGQSLRGKNNRYGVIQVEIGAQAANEFTSYDRGVANAVMALWYLLNRVSKGTIPISVHPDVKFVSSDLGTGPHRWKPDPEDVPARLTVAQFKAASGLIGHQHSPGTFSMAKYNAKKKALGSCSGKNAYKCRSAALVGDDHSDPGAINPYSMMNIWADLYEWFRPAY